jgi:hypothetical protein
VVVVTLSKGPYVVVITSCKGPLVVVITSYKGPMMVGSCNYNHLYIVIQLQKMYNPKRTCIAKLVGQL